MYFLQVFRNFIIYIKNYFNSIISLNEIVHYETRYLSLVLHREETLSNRCVSLVGQHTEKFCLQDILIFILKIVPESLLYQLFIPLLNAFFK